MLRLLASLVTLLVSSQQDFDALSGNLRAALAGQPEEVKVVFEPGMYRFRDDQILLSGLKCPGTRISFEGNGAVLTGTAPSVQAGPFTRMGSYVEVVDSESKLCRIRTRERLNGPGTLWVQITSWYRTFTAPVTEIKGKYLYFKLDALAREGLTYNVNGDLSFGKQRPRFRLLRVQEASDPVSTTAFHFSACEFRGISLAGFVIDRNAGRRTEYGRDCAVRFYRNALGGAEIRSCTFRHLQSDAVHILFTDQVDVLECRFEDCGRKGVRSINASAHTRILDCTFERMDRSLSNSPCIYCAGEEYLISGNRFVDYGNCAISLGVHFTEEMSCPSSGIVEKNELYQTDAYRSAAPMNLLMDTGGIYVNTQNTALTIRNNSVHDISGPYANRGIFCDDGTVNTTISGNRVLRIANSYGIDLRRVLSVESRPDSRIRRVNVGNRLDHNQVDGKIRFEER